MEKALSSFVSEAGLQSLTSLAQDLAASNLFSSLIALFACSASVLFGLFIAVVGSLYIYVGTGLSLASRVNSENSNYAPLIIVVGGMVAIEGLLVWVSIKGATNYCPAIFGSNTSHFGPTQ